MIRRFVPVYLITGFIESGKTTLGLTVLGNERFTNGGKVLVLCCEEGEVEWDAKSLAKYKGVLEMLDSAEDLTTTRLAQLDQRYEQEEIRGMLAKLSDEEEYGRVLRAKGILQDAAGSWFQFDWVPGEAVIRDGSADYTGRLAVIGADLNEKALTELFHL